MATIKIHDSSVNFLVTKRLFKCTTIGFRKLERTRESTLKFQMYSMKIVTVGFYAKNKATFLLKIFHSIIELHDPKEP